MANSFFVIVHQATNLCHQSFEKASDYPILIIRKMVHILLQLSHRIVHVFLGKLLMSKCY